MMQHLPALQIYQKPSKYEDFVAELVSACKSGDYDSKKLMQDLVSHLVNKPK